MSSMFCRHGRFEDRCAICRREKAEAAPAAATPAKKGTAARRASSSVGTTASPSASRRSRGVVTGKLSRNADDGYRSELLPGVRSSADVLELARELTVAEARLEALAEGAGPWAAVADEQDSPARAFVVALTIAVASPDPVAGSEATAQAAAEALLAGYPAVGELAADAASGPVAALLDAGPRGPRGHDAAGAALGAPAQLAARSGTLEAAITGDACWSPERRFARIFDRLALKGLPRAVRFDVLVALGRTGALAVRADGLHLGNDQVTAAAKRIFAVGDTALLEKRAGALVEATGVRWDALELALWNLAGADATGAGAAARWSTAQPPTTLGLPGEPDEELAETIAAALG